MKHMRREDKMVEDNACLLSLSPSKSSESNSTQSPKLHKGKGKSLQAAAKKGRRERRRGRRKGKRKKRMILLFDFFLFTFFSFPRMLEEKKNYISQINEAVELANTARTYSCQGRATENATLPGLEPMVRCYQGERLTA